MSVTTGEKYEIGQVLYLFSSQDRKVVPVQVVEEIVRKTMGSDVTVDYMVQPPTKSSPINLKDVEVSVYTDIGDLKSDMVQNATDFIDKVVENAKRVASKSFETLGSSEEEVLETEVENPDAGDLPTQVVLENGQVANVRFSPEIKENHG